MDRGRDRDWERGKTEDDSESEGELRHAASLARVPSALFDKGDVEEGTVRVDELKGEEFGDQRVLVLRVGAVVLFVSQRHCHLVVYLIQDLQIAR
jgi:hypothetical protein